MLDDYESLEYLLRHEKPNSAKMLARKTIEAADMLQLFFLEERD